MKKIYSLAGVLFFLMIVSAAVHAQTATVLLRPTHVDIVDDNARGAVLINLSEYPSDDVRYRLFNGVRQYNPWNPDTDDYVTVTAYASAPLAPGTPSTSATFWIPYVRGNNDDTHASYRDRLGPEYNTNYQTQALPSATGIDSEARFLLSGKLLGAASLPLTDKYVTLAFDGETLVSASHSDLTSGNFQIVIPDGTSINKIEVRTLLDVAVGHKTGHWSEEDDIGDIQLAESVDVNLSDLKVDGTTLEDFAADKTAYLANLDAGTTTVPEVTATAADSEATVSVTPATDLRGNAGQRTTTVLVTGRDGTTTKTYSIRFDPLIEVGILLYLRDVTEYDRLYMITAEVTLTGQMDFRNRKYLQDATGGIRIDDNDGVITTSYNLGDGIRGLKGTLGLSNGVLQLYPVEDPGDASQTGLPLDPIVVTVNSFKENHWTYESRLIMIEDVEFDADDVGNTFTNDASYTITSFTIGGESTILQTDFFGALTSVTIPEKANVTGIAIQHNGTAQIAPRMADDIATATDIFDPVAGNIRLYPVPVTTHLTIEGIEAFNLIEITDIGGRSVMSVNSSGAPSVVIPTGDLNRGVYFVRISSPTRVVVRRFIRQ